jgi:hypothetical protein
LEVEFWTHGHQFHRGLNGKRGREKLKEKKNKIIKVEKI